MRGVPKRDSTALVSRKPAAVGAAHRDVLEQIRERITEKDIDGCMELLRDALKAETSIRVPEYERTLGGAVRRKYRVIPDFPVALTAVRLMFSYKFGNPPSHSELVVTQRPGGSKGGPQTVEDTVRELVASGADLKRIMDSWLGMVENVTPVAPKDVSAQKSTESEVVEV